MATSDIITGLHLLRMLQKRYGEFEENLIFLMINLETN